MNGLIKVQEIFRNTMRKHYSENKVLQEKFGDPIGSYAGDAPVGVRSVEESCVGCGLPHEECICSSSDTCPVCGMMPMDGACGCGDLNESEENMKTCEECGMLEVEGSCGCTHMQESDLEEVAPAGYEKIVKALKKNPDIDNPWALAWWMKSQKMKPKKVKAESKEKYFSQTIKEETASVGKDIKGSSTSEKASEMLSKNKTLMSIVDKITTKDSLADFLQATLKMASEKGIDQSEAEGALKKVLASMKQ